MNRRKFPTASGALASLATVPRALADWQPSQRYPDPLINIIDPSFAKYRLSLAKVERIASGMRWCEGPVWFGDGRYLLWSDIPNNRIMKWEEETGAVSVFRKPSNNANGNTRDRQGRGWRLKADSFPCLCIPTAPETICPAGSRQLKSFHEPTHP